MAGPNYPLGATIGTGSGPEGAQATLIAGRSSGGTMQPVAVDTSGSLTITPAAAGPGALAQASTTSGQAGTLAMGAATTAAPSYTTGKTYPLSLTTVGGLRSALLDAAGAELDYTSPIPTYGSLIAANDLTPYVLNIASATTTEAVAAVAGQTTRVHRLRINVAAANIITIKDGTTTLEVLNFTAAGFLTYDFSSRPWYATTANTALNITTSTSAQVNGVMSYVRSA